MTDPDPGNRFERELAARKAIGRYRTLRETNPSIHPGRVECNNRERINFSSNDYLGLSRHPHLLKKSREAVQQFGSSAASSRLLTGTQSLHRQVEERLARWMKCDRALLFSTGFQANATLLPALAGRGDVIIADKECHNSMLHGCLMSRATLYRFRHNDLNHAETLLKKARSNQDGAVWLVTESLFSMNGDHAPLDALQELALRYGAQLYVDDAHAFGVYGEEGRGVCFGRESLGVVVTTFGKAAGSFGAAVFCSDLIAEFIINTCSGFIYTTALPPAIVGALDAALDLIPAMDEERTRLLSNAEKVRRSIAEAGRVVVDGSSHIIPVVIGDDHETVRTARELEAQDLLVSAIRPPTVPEGSARLRISLTSDHTDEDIQKLITALQPSDER
ncbi:MAG: aminotransferase class I/II-fold pyridoxal phosphate-dependent enzyme [Balneolaceae bacterium]